MLEEGTWKNFAASEEYRKRKEANKDSYFWDGLLWKTYRNALAGVLIGGVDLGKQRNPINEMAKELRLTRRLLSKRMLEAIENFPETGDVPARHLIFMTSPFELRSAPLTRTSIGDSKKATTTLRIRVSAYYGRGFSVRNVWQMKAFYLAWPILQTPPAELAESEEGDGSNEVFADGEDKLV